MQKTNIVDDVNQRTMHAAVAVYSAYDELSAPERVALASVSERMRGKSILDLGVGGGRTVQGLREISADYIGVDYVQGMVDSCRNKFPGVRFEHADARAMPQFADHSFDLIVFAWAGICMVDHEGRLAILKEVRRLLRPGGIFIFSTYNQSGPDHNQSFEFPEFAWTANPLKLAVRALRFARDSGTRARNKYRFRRHEVRSKEYSIINDRCHDYATMLYYITLANQRHQLQQAGFVNDAIAYDGNGNRIEGDTTDNAYTLLVGV
jgi:ubiquinone/menaquinone biosynthesis C-methylase UbiE